MFGNIYGFAIENPFGAACNYEIKDLWMYRIEDKISSLSKGSLVNIINQIKCDDINILPDELEDIQRTKIDEALSDDFGAPLYITEDM